MLLQQQISSQNIKPAFDTLPSHIISTLDNMAFGIAQKENLDSYDVKQKLVSNVNKLAPADIEYLKTQMSILIDKSVHNKETIDDSNVDKDFITFLIRLYY